MSNIPAPKTSFWQTIPGLITATAGFLSAATGAIVALNQTGVVDLKKVAGDKPPEQTTPAVTASAPAPAQPSERKTAEADAAKPEPMAGAPAQVQPARPAGAVPPPTAESKAPASVPEAKEESVTTKSLPQPSEPAPAPEKAPAPTPSAPERMTEAVPQKSETPPASAPSPAERPPGAPPGKLPAETKAPGITPAPPPPGSQPAPGRPPAGDRLADARRAERLPQAPPDSPKIVRPPSEAPPPRITDKGVDRTPARGRPAVRGAVAAPGGPQQLELSGLTLTIPPGWMRAEVGPSPLAPDAILVIPDPGGDGRVTISRYLGAKGKELEERTLNRWVAQVTGPGGVRLSPGDARIEKRQAGPVRITTVDLSGTVRLSAREPGAPDHRLIGAILDHPLGPHLVVVTGPAQAMARWMPAIDAFLNSAAPR